MEKRGGWKGNSKSGEGWEKVRMKNQREVTSRGRNQVPRWSQFTERLRASTRCGVRLWCSRLGLCSHPCRLKGPSELCVANWSFYKVKAMPSLLGKPFRPFLITLLLTWWDFASLLWSPYRCSKLCISVPQWTMKISISPILLEGFGRGCGESFAWTHLIPQPEGPMLRLHWKNQAPNSTGSAQPNRDFSEHCAPGGRGRSGLSASGPPGIISRQMWNILGQIHYFSNWAKCWIRQTQDLFPWGRDPSSIHRSEEEMKSWFLWEAAKFRNRCQERMI